MYQLSNQGQATINKSPFSPRLTKEPNSCFYCGFKKKKSLEKELLKMRKDFKTDQISGQNPELDKNEAAPREHWESLLFNTWGEVENRRGGI